MRVLKFLSMIILRYIAAFFIITYMAVCLVTGFLFAAFDTLTVFVRRSLGSPHLKEHATSN